MYKYFFTGYVLSLLCGVSANSTAQAIPEKATVLKTMRLANSYFMNKWPDAGKTIITNKERKSTIWTRAVYYEGLMALNSIEPKKKSRKSYQAYAMQWGDKHDWSLNGSIKTRNADNHCAGQTYYDLFVLKGRKDSYMLDSIKASIDLMMAGNKIDDWSWIDALQMAMPVFTRLGLQFNDTAYFNRMYAMYAFSKYHHGGKGLYNAADKLWWRDKDFVFPYKEPNGEDCYWSRGNGWVLAALVRVIDLLPATDPHYNEYLQDYKDMCTALLPLQRADGLWNVSLHDSTHFGGKELTGTALFTYGFAYGINKGVLDQNIYQSSITKAWNAMQKDCVHPNGFLGWVQGTGKEPKDGQPLSYDKVPDFEDYGLGCFLLAGSEVYKMKR
ncbi:MAG: glycoside hydrolase family 88 protein [Sphingobacteriales bacterium]|nr:MAG: glycoside hydrolase family 88 protein [Sphingobacteriales bacterium]